jgi:hypothetical protein
MILDFMNYVSLKQIDDRVFMYLHAIRCAGASYYWRTVYIVFITITKVQLVTKHG